MATHRTSVRPDKRGRALAEYRRLEALRESIATDPRPADIPLLTRLDAGLRAWFARYVAAGGDFAHFYELRQPARRALGERLGKVRRDYFDKFPEHRPVVRDAEGRPAAAAPRCAVCGGINPGDSSHLRHTES